MVQTRSQRRAKASASRLPPEVLRMIFARFCPHCRGDVNWPHWAHQGEMEEKYKQDTNALFSLCLVSSSFRNVAQEIMFHYFGPQYAHGATPNTWSRRLEPFLRTIASRPDLASTVKAVSLEPPLIDRLDFCAGAESLKEWSYVLRVDTILPEWLRARNHQPGRGLYIQGETPFFMKRDDPEFIFRQSHLHLLASELVTMLIALLPNLQHLKVNSTIENFDLSHKIIKYVKMTPLSLKALDTSHCLEPLFKLAQKVETLIVRSDSAYPSRALPNVKVLRVLGNSTSIAAIQGGIAVCIGQLSEFSYQGTNLSAAAVIGALDIERLRAFLETLHIDLRYEFHPPLFRRRGSIPSLKDFQKLQTVFLTVQLIYRSTDLPSPDSHALSDILPPNIASLTLVENEGMAPFERLRQDFLHLAKAKPTLFKKLRIIRCDVKEACDQCVKDSFGQVDVHFSYQEFSRPDINERQYQAERNSWNIRTQGQEQLLGWIVPIPSDSDDDL